LRFAVRFSFFKIHTLRRIGHRDNRYAHAGGENDALVPGTIPTDPTGGYSHVNLQDMDGFSRFSVADVRFYCHTSNHDRKIHFKTSHSFQLGVAFNGSLSGNDPSYWNSDYTALAGHTAYLPGSAHYAFTGSSDGFWNFPFYESDWYHWGIRGAGDRFECDDFPASSAYTTLHQVWVRQHSTAPTPQPTMLVPDHELNFQGCSDGTDVVDAYDPSVTATAMNGAACSADGMEFDGVDDYLDLTPWPFGGEPMSVEVYVKYGAFKSWSRIFDFGDGEADDNVVLLNVWTSATARFTIYVGEGGGNGGGSEGYVQDCGCTHVSVTQDAWVHLVATVDGSTMKIYVDGVLTGTETNGLEPASLTRTQHWVGKSHWDNEYLDATIAYLRFWHGQAISAGQVAKLYANRPAPSPTPLPTTLAPTAGSQAWAFSNVQSGASGRFEKTAGSDPAYDAYAVTNEAVRSVSVEASGLGHVRVGFMDAGDTANFESGAMFGMWPVSNGPNEKSYTTCGGENGAYVSDYQAGDTIKLEYDVSSGDVTMFINDALQRTCPGASDSYLHAAIWIYELGSYASEVHVEPRAATFLGGVWTQVSDGQVIGTVDISLDYSLKFDLDMVGASSNAWDSIIHVGDDDDERMPGVWFRDFSSNCLGVYDKVGTGHTSTRVDICDVFSPGNTYSVEIKVEGTTLSVFVDGALEGTVTVARSSSASRSPNSKVWIG